MWQLSAVLLLALSVDNVVLGSGQQARAEAITAAPPRPTKRANQASVNHISMLWSDALSLISQNYPSSTITNVAALSWPSTVVVEGSTYVVQAGSTVAPQTSASSTTPASAASTSTPASSVASTFATSSMPSGTASQLVAASTASPTSSPQSSSSGNKSNLVVVLAVVCAILGVVILLGILWCCYRTWKRRRATSDDESGYQSWTTSKSGSQMAEDTSYRYGDRSIPPIPTDAHRYSRGSLTQDMTAAPAENPFIAPEERRQDLQPESSQVNPRGTDRDNWWATPEAYPPRPVSTSPTTGPWVPPRSPKRKPVQDHTLPSEPSSFNFGFPNGQHPPNPTVQPRTSNLRISTSNGSASSLPSSHSTPRRSPMPSGGSTPRSSGYHNNRYSPIIEDEAT